MPYHCVAYGCGRTSDDGVTLYRFPKDPEEFRKWEKQVQRTRSHWTAMHTSHLCSEHFGKEYFEQKQPIPVLKSLAAKGLLKLKPGAVPTVFIRPPCSICEGGGCNSCLPRSQRKGIPVVPMECDMVGQRHHTGAQFTTSTFVSAVRKGTGEGKVTWRNERHY